MMGYRVGVDIGGTFTDIAIVTSDGRRFSKKVPSTPDDFARAIIDGLMQSVDDGMVDLAGITELIHGTTVASNAILELKGARTGLITTAGFRDILEIRNLRMPRLYDLSWTKPPALVERYLRVEVRERVNAKGEIEIPIDEADIERAVQRLLDEEVEAIAVCLLHSYANPDHERVIKRVVERMAPGLTLCISSEVLPEIKEYERTSTTVINAYVRPIVRHYLASLTSELRRIGVARPLLLMQSNGGLTSAESASAMPMNIIESGPAAGVIGVHALAQEIGLDKVISFDMGGTTAKASIIERGIVSRASEYSVGGGIMLGSRLLTGAGYTLKVPAIDLAEVGAGGGSILWIDVGGALQIGPHSAGATPGPVCYDAGGTEPTVTDANIVLGYLNPDHLVGGSLKLKAEKSVAALRERIAEPLGLSVEDAAHGAHLIAASNMIRAIKAVSSERGRDPREFALVGFGGNGPLFAAGMAQTLGIGQVIIPHHAGVFSSFGLLASDVEHHGSRSIRAPLRAIDPAVLGTMFAEMQAEGLARVADDGVAASRAEVTRTLGLRYLGQSFDLPVAVPPGPITADTLLALEQAYGAEHEQTYGHRGAAGETVEMVVARLVVRGIDPDRHVRHAGQPAATGKPPSSRRAYFGRDHGWLDTPVLDRAALALPRVGPCIIEEYDSTCVVPPGCHAALSDAGNIVITIAR